LETLNAVTSSITLGTIQQQLDHELFFRINRGQVINLNYVSSYTKKGALVIAELINGRRFVFSRRRSKDFQKRQESITG
jgi:DNA-binding LytR/AlgR family response regulator